MSRVDILVVTMAYYELSTIDHDANFFGLLERMSIEKYLLKEVIIESKSDKYLE